MAIFKSPGSIPIERGMLLIEGKELDCIDIKPSTAPPRIELATKFTGTMKLTPESREGFKALIRLGIEVHLERLASIRKRLPENQAADAELWNDIGQYDTLEPGDRLPRYTLSTEAAEGFVTRVLTGFYLFQSEGDLGGWAMLGPLAGVEGWPLEEGLDGWESRILRRADGPGPRAHHTAIAIMDAAMQAVEWAMRRRLAALGKPAPKPDGDLPAVGSFHG